MTTLEKITQQLSQNPIILYMKGSPQSPLCGFSARAVKVLSACACGQNFSYIDILQHPDIRTELPNYSNWPTFPQLWIENELIGGCDIMVEMYRSGEIQQLIKEISAKYYINHIEAQ
ncbi:Grx4 family monothiol glutaredoxin [Candidatus Profftia tarda]|uniref:Glutaredoxin n=1 Tax=Candidatus Profftia tarda TaxID=1177216 RepID=A0A8E4EZS2_9ENTR|nr:Grx4 family monothiol glutaredoxin [Candidatus Profftia tarda]CAD6507523.1 Glutaredoxin-4 [Candidatus Profftia tarda]